MLISKAGCETMAKMVPQSRDYTVAKVKDTVCGEPLHCHVQCLNVYYALQ